MNTEAGLQNSQDAVDDEEYVGDTQIVDASDATFPQGNLYSSEHKSVVLKKKSDVCLLSCLTRKMWLLLGKV